MKKIKINKLEHLMYIVWLNEISSYSLESGSQVSIFQSLCSDITLADIVENRIAKEKHYKLLQECFKK